MLLGYRRPKTLSLECFLGVTNFTKCSWNLILQWFSENFQYFTLRGTLCAYYRATKINNILNLNSFSTTGSFFLNLKMSGGGHKAENHKAEFQKADFIRQKNQKAENRKAEWLKGRKIRRRNSSEGRFFYFTKLFWIYWKFA